MLIIATCSNQLTRALGFLVIEFVDLHSWTGETFPMMIIHRGDFPRVRPEI